MQLLDICLSLNQNSDLEEEELYLREKEVERDGRKLNQNLRKQEELKKQKFIWQERQIKEKLLEHKKKLILKDLNEKLLQFNSTL